MIGLRVYNAIYKSQMRQERSKYLLRQAQTFALVGGTVGGGIVGIYSLFSNEVTGSITVSILLSVLAALIVPIITYTVKTKLLNRSPENDKLNNI